MAGQSATWLKHMQLHAYAHSALPVLRQLAVAQSFWLAGSGSMVPWSDNVARRSFHEHILSEDSSSKSLFLNTYTEAVAVG